MTVKDMAISAGAAGAALAESAKKRKIALFEIAGLLLEDKAKILEANSLDLKNARENGMSEVMLDRLMLTAKRIEEMAEGVREINLYNDPVGITLEGIQKENGLNIQKITVPMGVIGIIYESRPNVTSDCAALCLKAGSSVILRGGKEAYNSNLAITCAIRKGLDLVGLPTDCVQLVGDTSRASANEMMGLSGFIDLLIPRGGAGLIKAVVENSKVPVIETGTGNCHIYVDEFANLKMAEEIVFNAKTSRPSVCNSAETLLVHEAVAEKALPAIVARLKEKRVDIRGCEKTQKIIKDCTPANEADWQEEFLDYILAVKVVSSIDEAIEHIAKYSSGHSEVIVTESYKNAELFISAVDSAAVYVNASTRFTDGGVFGLGAEIGISTQKLHARGPMGLTSLVSYKYVIRGDGQIR